MLISSFFVSETTPVGVTAPETILAFTREYLSVVPVVPVVAMYVPSKGAPTPCTRISEPTEMPWAVAVVNVATFVVIAFVVTANVLP